MGVWTEDADQLTMDSKELNIIYKNRKIDLYLQTKSHILGLAGVKGQGKTFLIKVKRKSISIDLSTICLPYNKMVDTVDNSLTIDKSLRKYLCIYKNWVNIWKFTICATVLTAKDIRENINLDKLKDKTKELLRISNNSSEPSVILTQLLNMNINELMTILGDTGKLFEQLKSLRNSVCVFIDKLDQGLSNYTTILQDSIGKNESYWEYCQYALAESSYDIFTNTGRQIKIYYTIRQEALIDSAILNKNKARNINSYLITLEYTKNDLKNMYNNYIKNETRQNLKNFELRNSSPSKAFIGFEEVQHGYIDNKYENVFDYIYRHTFKRPYDIMKICNALYQYGDLEVKDLRHIVNHQSTEILKLYIQELSSFLPCNLQDIEDLIKMCPANILSRKSMKDICSLFHLEHSSNELWACNQDCSSCTSIRPFSMLYNIGLLGYDRLHEADEIPVISFSNIGSSILELDAHILPQNGKYFYLHPTLSNMSRDIRNNLGLSYKTSNAVIVGDNYKMDAIPNKITNNIRNVSYHLSKEKIFVSSTIFDLKKERRAVRKNLRNRGLHPIMSEHNEFNLHNAQRVHSHDHCLNQVKKCKGFIFVIGNEYGGYYKGNDYLDEKEEIKSLSGGKISNPSISLMEYYIARKNKSKCYVFMAEEIEDKYQNKLLKEEMKSEIDFITHFQLNDNIIKGNWISHYKDMNEFVTFLNSCKFINARL